MVIPAKARKEACIDKGDVVNVQPEGRGRILLVKLERPHRPKASKARLIYRKGTHAVVAGGRKPTEAELRDALAEFP